MIFQYSLGIDISEERVIFVLLKGSLRGVEMMDHAYYSLDPSQSADERVDITGELAREYIKGKRIGSPQVFIGFPAENALIQKLTFPAAVKENLSTTLKYEIEKYIPISPSDLFFSHHIISEEKANNRINVLLIAVKKDVMTPYLKFADLFRGGISGLETNSTAFMNYIYTDPGSSKPVNDLELISVLRDPEKMKAYVLDGSSHKAPSNDLAPAYGLALKGLSKPGFGINLLPPEHRKKPNKIGVYSMFALIALIAAALLGLGGIHVYQRHMMLKEINSRIETLSSDVQKYDRLLADIQQLEERIDYINELQGGSPPLIEILRELTQTLPETAWVQELSYSDDSVVISGEAESANDLIRLFEKSIIFENAHPLSPTVKGRSGKEKYKIIFKIQNRKELSDK